MTTLIEQLKTAELEERGEIPASRSLLQRFREWWNSRVSPRLRETLKLLRQAHGTDTDDISTQKRKK